jgi:hypothetical protein
MDQISRIRFKNLIESLLAYTDGAETEEEKAVLMRINIVMLNKLRVHANVDTMLGCDVRELTKRVDSCSDRGALLDLWDDTVDLVGAYGEAMA